MQYFDVFNGDADGICALVQLRLAAPRESVLVTGIKRDISLLAAVKAKPGDKVTVLDISMQKNHVDLERILAAGADVFYVDHHQSGDIPAHKNLRALIDLSPIICTSLIVDNYLNHRFHFWAITAAFGDNLQTVGLELADKAGLSQHQTSQLQSLGTLLNYNGYGGAIDDLFYHPADLYRACVAYPSPLDFIANEQAIFSILQGGFDEDMSSAQSIKPCYQSSAVALFELPNGKWARRVSGVWGNDLSNRHPVRSHLILTPIDDENYRVSIRAPLSNRHGAESVASQFATGGGRAGAAGINVLHKSHVADLVAAMEKQYA